MEAHPLYGALTQWGLLFLTKPANNQKLAEWPAQNNSQHLQPTMD